VIPSIVIIHYSPQSVPCQEEVSPDCWAFFIGDKMLTEEERKQRERERNKKYYQENKEKIYQRRKKYKEKCGKYIKQYSSDYYHRNKEKILKKAKEYREQNKDLVKEARKKSRLKHYDKEKQKEKNKQFYLKNPLCIAAIRHKRRARTKNASSYATKEQIKARFDYYDNKCYYCGDSSNLQVEHRIPLARGGSNWPANIVPACKCCNNKKYTKTEKEFREL